MSSRSSSAFSMAPPPDFIGGKTDEVMMRIVDVLYALPFIFFVIMLVVFFGRNFVLMFLAVGAVLWLDMARIVRGQALSMKRQEYVQAAEALGVTRAGILLPPRRAEPAGPGGHLHDACWCHRSSSWKASCPSSALACRSRCRAGACSSRRVPRIFRVPNWLLFFPSLLPHDHAFRAQLHRRRPA